MSSQSAINTDGDFWEKLNTTGTFSTSYPMPTADQLEQLRNLKSLTNSSVEKVNKAPLTDQEIASLYTSFCSSGSIWSTAILERVSKEFAGGDVAVSLVLSADKDASVLTTQYYGWNLKSLSFTFIPQDTTMVSMWLNAANSTEDMSLVSRLFQSMDKLRLPVAELKELVMSYIKAQPAESFRMANMAKQAYDPALWGNAQSHQFGHQQGHGIPGTLYGQGAVMPASSLTISPPNGALGIGTSTSPLASYGGNK
jgi:hypothetical protein